MFNLFGYHLEDRGQVLRLPHTGRSSTFRSSKVLCDIALHTPHTTVGSSADIPAGHDRDLSISRKKSVAALRSGARKLRWWNV